MSRNARPKIERPSPINGTAYGQFGHFGKTLPIPSLSKPKRFNVCHRHASTIYRVLPVPYQFRQSVLNPQKTVVLSSLCAPLLSPLHAHAPHTSPALFLLSASLNLVSYRFTLR
ncbi:hypothetical protein L3X38_006795 [Prunus dulcis]|uniref:Uncharacterized protein n=1 Tax=Prunus dulcis TaxID=3755 RepID=A0AAD4ZTP5_PRUDU|nr:hypothetical protein L3X38_006795 [Prunus dulcis]